MPQTRLNVNINRQTETALRNYANDHEVTITEAVRRFTGVADHIMQAIDRGGEILVRTDGQTERITFTY